jgi:hypothetical protein
MVTLSRRRLARVFALAVAATAVAWALAHGFDTGAAFMAPALLLLAPLLKGRYICEERFTRLMTRTPAIRAPRQIAKPRVLVRIIHGGELIARSLAVRPPPTSAT